ncbi:MAG: ABC transporter ATP-binding protein [Methylacidiphilales bacterium]|nr:ABC transporter ATP-binding protein [Candidatus Methylacidiphilales bacterium]
MISPVLEIIEVLKSYSEGNPILNKVSCSIYPGQSIALYGASGSGKSTFLHIIAGLLKSDSGMIKHCSIDISNYSEQQWSLFRLKHIGFVFQRHHLVRELTVEQNIALPLYLTQVSSTTITNLVRELLNQVSLQNKNTLYPYQLSGGERQRVAIARALITNPSVVIADEPTGNLDPHTKEHIINLLLNLCNQSNKALLIATHDQQISSKVTRRLNLTFGNLQEE